MKISRYHHSAMAATTALIPARSLIPTTHHLDPFGLNLNHGPNRKRSGTWIGFRIIHETEGSYGPHGNRLPVPQDFRLIDTYI
jgi:hypothetical protein